MITRALLRRPAATLTDGITGHPQFGAPDVDLCLRQFDAYAGALRNLGLDLTILPADDRFPDGHYVEDTAVIFRDMAFITRPGSAARAQEVASIAENLRDLHQVHMRDDESQLEGGDVLFCADRVLIGIAGRTNIAGAEELAAALRTVQPDLRVDFVPFAGVLHLKSGLTELAPGILVHDPAMKMDYDFGLAEVVTLPPEEGYAGCILPVNEAVIIPAGYPTVQKVAEQHAANVIALEMSEFRKMDGGLTCLSLRY